jgi:hypothetical protein
VNPRIALRYSLAALCLATTASCGSSGGVGDVRGAVTVDGQPAELGTIHFQPAESSGGRGVGAAIKEGQFQLPSEHGLSAGKYRVAVQASKKSGRTFTHPQQGELPVLIQLELADSPKEVELTSENAASLAINFASRKK